jgi:hypothetical protein
MLYAIVKTNRLPKLNFTNISSGREDVLKR